ncbi:MAG TPA: histidine kinase, partial [Bacteroidia bacterium]|nr:histidine kinase [Bacteroidia bacterium]
LCIVICYFITCFIPAVLISYKRFMPFFFETFHNIFVFLVIFFISFTLKISRQWKLAEEQKLTAELSNLKAQVRPHFLFNTLNSIYSLSVTNSEATSSAIVKLSNLMRYLLSESNQDYAELEKEINYLTDYIELQKIRLGETVKIDFTVEGIIADQYIAPLILIPFVENSFKHGVNPEEDSRISIHITINNKGLNMIVSNNKVSHSKNANDPDGTGIENVRKRLQLLYPSNHNLLILDKENVFIVELKINLL